MRSGDLAPSFAPTIVIIEESASVRLLIASRITAIELERMPTKALNATRKRFAIIPIILVRTIILFRFSQFVLIRVSIIIKIP